MGTWNVGIFQNDIAEDVKIEYIEFGLVLNKDV